MPWRSSANGLATGACGAGRRDCEASDGWEDTGAGAASDTGAGWSGVMPFTSGSGLGAGFSAPFVGSAAGSSTGVVTIS